MSSDRRWRASLIGAACLATSCTPATSRLDAPAEAPPVVQAAGEAAQDAEARERAIARARQALEERGLAASGLEVESVTEAQWSDSSLGCRQQGLVYLPVITSGHVVVLTGDRQRHEVHVAGESAVVCESMARGVPRRPPTAIPARNLEAMVAAAKEDLAARLGGSPESIRVVDVSPVQLPPGPLGCEPPAGHTTGRTAPGFRILLDREGRRFAYFTDLAAVTVCPPIERD